MLILLIAEPGYKFAGLVRGHGRVHRVVYGKYRRKAARAETAYGVQSEHQVVCSVLVF